MVAKKLGAYENHVYQEIVSQTKNQDHPLIVIAKELSSQFVFAYRTYTGAGQKKLDSRSKKEMESQIMRDSKQLNSQIKKSNTTVQNDNQLDIVLETTEDCDDSELRPDMNTNSRLSMGFVEVPDADGI